MTDDKLRSTNERLKAALEARAQQQKRVDEFRKEHEAEFQRQIAEQNALIDAVFAIPDQAERRRLLDEAGLSKMSAAPRPLEPIRPSIQPEEPNRSPNEPRWPVWLALPKLKLWQCVALSVGIEPSDRIKGLMQSVRHVNRRFWGGLPFDFFDRLDVCKQALSTEGPITPQGPLYQGMLSDSNCPVLLKEVAAFMQVAKFEIPAQLAELTLSNATVEALAIVQPEAKTDQKQKKWTDERLSEMAAFRKANGTKKTAEKYDISEARVRQLLPSDEPQPTGYSAFNQRLGKP